MQVFLLQPRANFLKDLKAIPFKCYHQEEQGLRPPVSGGGEKPRREMPVGGHSGSDGISTDQPPISVW